MEKISEVIGLLSTTKYKHKINNKILWLNYLNTPIKRCCTSVNKSNGHFK